VLRHALAPPHYGVLVCAVQVEEAHELLQDLEFFGDFFKLMQNQAFLERVGPVQV
jgi:hypothetical protein